MCSMYTYTRSVPTAEKVLQADVHRKWAQLLQSARVAVNDSPHYQRIVFWTLLADKQLIENILFGFWDIDIASVLWARQRCIPKWHCSHFCFGRSVRLCSIS